MTGPQGARLGLQEKCALTLDYLHGPETYEQLAERYGLYPWHRSAQIVKEVLKHYRVIGQMQTEHARFYIAKHKPELARTLGLKLQRARGSWGDEYDPSTPAGFYWEERRHDEQEANARKYGEEYAARRW